MLDYIMTPEAIEAEKAVERGATMLDENEPGWFRKIDIKELDIDSPSNCICGQVFMGRIINMDGFEYALNHFTAWKGEGSSVRVNDWIRDHGFAGLPFGAQNGRLNGSELTAMLWVEQIEKRLADEGEML